MKSSSSLRDRIAKTLGFAAVATVALGFSSSFATPPEGDATRPVIERVPPTGVRPTPEERETWRKSMAHTPAPKKGCFKSSYPSRTWKEIPCIVAPQKPYPPAKGLRPETVGDGTDFSASVLGTTSSATGSFNSVSGVTSESDGTSNTYSLQLNTQFFNTPVCGGSASPGSCQGWQQFIYSNSGIAFMQYWLLNWNTTCPSGWITFGSDCYMNSSGASVPVQPLSNLANLTLTGNATGGGMDTVVLSTGTDTYTATGNDNVLDVSGAWQVSEYNVIGDGGGSEATFNSGSTIVVRTAVNYGSSAAPNCVLEGFTGETNNLTLVGTPSATGAPEPSIVFTESNIAGSPASCATATSDGDTHLTTFEGLYYDFQASGDFLLAQAGPEFSVQTRQVSGAPSWPNASVNHAVATQMGQNHVAICLLPTRLEINGEARDLGDGGSVTLPGGVRVARSGDIYTLKDQSGNSVRATLNNNGSTQWIDVSVGLGRAALEAKPHGLLASAEGNTNAIAMSDGTVLREPVAFNDLYHPYADSWRVPAGQSLLCNDQRVEIGVPLKPFYATDLTAQQQDRARSICTAQGVKGEAALDSCVLDVSVLGGEQAAKIFVRMRAPTTVLHATMAATALKP